MPVMLTKQEQKIYENAKKFAIDELKPMASMLKYGEASITDLFKLYKKQGYISLLIPKNRGGMGYTFLETALIYEGLAHGSGILTFLLQLHNNITYEIEMLYNTSPCLDQSIKAMISGDALTAFAFTEEKCGSDAASIEAYAEKKEDGYHIHGKKVWIANAADADYINVIVRDGKGKRDMLMLLVEKGTKGMTIGENHRLFGGNEISCCDISFDDCIVPQEGLLTSNGFKEALKAIDIARIFVPSIANGISDAAIEETIQYLKTRESFGEPIISYQGVGWSLAELSTKLEASKWFCYHCASLMDDDSYSKSDTAMNKLNATNIAMEVAIHCMQYQGANGYAENSPIANIVAEAKLFQIIDGTSEIQKIIIGRGL